VCNWQLTSQTPYPDPLSHLGYPTLRIIYKSFHISLTLVSSQTGYPGLTFHLPWSHKRVTLELSLFSLSPFACSRTTYPGLASCWVSSQERKNLKSPKKHHLQKFSAPSAPRHKQVTLDLRRGNLPSQPSTPLWGGGGRPPRHCEQLSQWP
jgi:hypothetical protein